MKHLHNFKQHLNESYKRNYEQEQIELYDEIKNDFEIVDGEEIKKWFNLKNIEGKGRHGSLYGSHMNTMSPDTFEIYANNTEKIKLLILKTPQGKLVGRAILWVNLNQPNGETFMSRPMVSHDIYINMFKYLTCINIRHFIR